MVRGRLWRRSNPHLAEADRERLVRELMSARRRVHFARKGGEKAAEAEALAAVDTAKRALGERGAVWWDDGAPDLNRHVARSTSYAAWFAGLPSTAARR